MRRSLVILLAVAPAALLALAASLVAAWAILLPGAIAALLVAGAAAAASSLGEDAPGVGSIGWRLAAVFARIVGIAGGMTLLADRPAVIALLAGVAAGWLVEMTLWTLRLAQERNPARA
jgi:hypothetical protein